MNSRLATTSSAPMTRTSELHTRGVMKFFDFVKAWGYISPEGGGRDIYVAGAILSTAGFIKCPKGTPLEVWYTLEPRGPRAIRVAPLGETDV